MSKMNLDYYKICFLGADGLPEKYIVFSSDSDSREKNIQTFFSQVEWAYIQEKGLESEILVPSDMKIHPDDTISAVKKKIIRALEDPGSSDPGESSDQESLSKEEIYLFSCVEKRFSPLTCYKRLTQLDTKPWTKAMLHQFVANFNGISNTIDAEDQLGGPLKEDDQETHLLQDPIYLEKSVYSYEDLLEMDWFYSAIKSGTSPYQKTQKIPLGLRFVERPHDPEDPRVLLNQDVFSSNPFDILFPRVYRPSKDVSLQPFESELLFHYTNGSNFLENTIYVCTYDAVLSFLHSKEIEETEQEEILSLYFPLSDSDSDSNKEKEKETEQYWQQEKLVDMIYDIYHDSKSSSSIYDIFSGLSKSLGLGLTKKKETDNRIHLKGGIYAFQFIMHPEKTNKLPLETIFKHIHASDAIPFITYIPAYHPGIMREKMFRFHFVETAQNGNPIPTLNKSTIQRLTKRVSKTENITMYVALPTGSFGADTFLAVSFESNGNIVVQADLEPSKEGLFPRLDNNTILPTNFNEWLEKIMVYPIQNMNRFTQSVGYSIEPFRSIQEENIEVIFLHYRARVVLEKKFDLEKWMGIFSPFFVSDTGSSSGSGSGSGGTGKRYTRVENYQRMDKYEEAISNLLRITQEKSQIQSELHRRFPELSLEKLRETMDKYQEKHQSVVIPGRFANKRVEMLEHSGFRTMFQKSTFENEWMVEVQEINALEYVFLLHMYLNVLFLVSQSPELVPVELLQKYKKPILLSSSLKPTALAIQKPFVPIFTEGLDLEEEKGDVDVDVEVEQKENSEVEVEVEQKEKGEVEVEVEVEKKVEVERVEEEDEDEYEIPDEYESEEEDEDDENEGSKEKKNGSKDGSKGGSKGKKATKGKKKPTTTGEEDGPNTLSTYFMQRIEKRDPLITEKGFSRICPANEKRQPIILTEKEKQKIDQQYTDPNDKPYSHAIKYGADKDDNPFYYICPAYWCVKPGEEGPLTETDVQNKKCGEIIQDPKNIQPGEYTYKGRETFSEPSFVNRKIKTGIHPKTGKEICFPCCFQNWNGKAQQERRNQCNPEEYGLHPKQKKLQEKKAMVPSTTRNVLDINRVPLPYGRIGLLQVPIQLFLNATTANLCVDSQNMPKLNCPLLIRYGANQPKYENQYFLGCLADMYSYQRNEIVAKTIPEIREILCSAISLDIFLQLHNASLVALFRYPKDDFLARNRPAIDIQTTHYAYQKTEFYKRLNPQDETHMDFLESTIESYENFLAYLRDEESVIDPTYLWEAVCQKNPALLPRGVNLAILEILNNDVTNNVELICPSCAYGTLYDPAKETWILVKQGDVYEPIYLYEITNLNPEKTSYKKTFLNSSLNTSSNSSSKKEVLDKSGINRILKMIQAWTLESCAPISRKAKGNVFERNIPAMELLKILNDLGDFAVKYQILNYQNKIIGFLVDLSRKEKEFSRKTSGKKDIFLPTFPSAILPKFPSKWMDEPDIWNTYDNTVFFLQEIYRLSDQRILSNLLYRVVEDEKVVGVITMTNQFLQIMPPIDNRVFSDGLKTLTSGNPIPRDRAIQLASSSSSSSNPNPEWSEKMKMVRNIRLETQFYQAFRNTVRMLLNLYKNRRTRETIRSTIFDRSKTYLEKRKVVEGLLKELGKTAFVFQEYSEEVLDKIQEVFLCPSSFEGTGEGDAEGEESNYCLLTFNEKEGEAGEPSLILPQQNLVNLEEENEKNYYRRLSDELVRFKRVRLFMMYPDAYLPLTSGEYKVNADEFVIPKSIMTEEYFSELKTYPLKKYVQTNTFETANPNTGIPANPTLLWKDGYEKAKK